MIDALRILHADDHLVVVHKPSGMLVHRGWGDDEVVAMTAARDLLGRWVYPVHRLDRGTSGALLFALDPEIARQIQAQFEAQAIHKVYRALVRGVPREPLVIDHPVPRGEEKDSPRVEAITEVTPLSSSGRYAWVEARPRTGRLHQIRRHLKHVSHPIIGDVNYGKGEHNRFFRDTYQLHRLALHAASIALVHPVSGERIEVSAPLPPDLQEPLARWDPSAF